MCVPVNIEKFLRTLILKNICDRLLLETYISLAFQERFRQRLRLLESLLSWKLLYLIENFLFVKIALFYA